MKPWHIIVLIVVLLIVFGTAKLPDIARSLGQSAKVMKKEIRELQDDEPRPLPPAPPQPGQQPGQLYQSSQSQQNGYQPGTEIPGQQIPQQPFPQNPQYPTDGRIDDGGQPGQSHQ
ncbi:Sec-independent protein translocase subunit TatA [Trueperella pyogenes]|uniref:Sec-independent protein translocase subunit TatA n=1 Tax=Trueperella pyogenes TaxID=1661 RepID=UPI00325483DC